MLPGRPRILIVEDDAPLRQMYRFSLELRGYDVDVAGDGVTALRKLEDAPAPQLVVLDLNLPQLDGFAVAAELESRSTTHGVPIVIATGSTQPFDEAPFAAVLRKPVSPEDLTFTVQRCLRNGQDAHSVSV